MLPRWRPLLLWPRNVMLLRRAGLYWRHAMRFSWGIFGWTMNLLADMTQPVAPLLLTTTSANTRRYGVALSTEHHYARYDAARDLMLCSCGAGVSAAGVMSFRRWEP